MSMQRHESSTCIAKIRPALFAIYIPAKIHSRVGFFFFFWWGWGLGVGGNKLLFPTEGRQIFPCKNYDLFPLEPTSKRDHSNLKKNVSALNGTSFKGKWKQNLSFNDRPYKKGVTNQRSNLFSTRVASF